MTMGDTIWILTEDWNDYNQHGSYFIAAWIEKPSTGEIMKSLKTSESEAQHILSGGGRRGSEDTWYSLFETKAGEACTTD